jgi:hypothetical protein
MRYYFLAPCWGKNSRQSILRKRRNLGSNHFSRRHRMNAVRMSHEEYVRQTAREVVQTALKAIDEETGLLLAARQIYTSLWTLPELQNVIKEEDFLFLKAVDSECDGLPLGSERQYWAPEALREKDVKSRPYEQTIAKDLLSTFARIAESLKQLL